MEPCQHFFLARTNSRTGSLGDRFELTDRPGLESDRRTHPSSHNVNSPFELVHGARRSSTVHRLTCPSARIELAGMLVEFDDPRSGSRLSQCLRRAGHEDEARSTRMDETDVRRVGRDGDIISGEYV